VDAAADAAAPAAAAISRRLLSTDLRTICPCFFSAQYISSVVCIYRNFIYAKNKKPLLALVIYHLITSCCKINEEEGWMIHFNTIRNIYFFIHTLKYSQT
jgi:hypothetical protein